MLRLSLSLLFIFASTSLSSASSLSPDEQFRVTFFNVGQGDCTIIESSQKGLLIVDAGSSDTSSVPNLPAKDKYKELAKKIVSHIETSIRTIPKLSFIVTHSDQDHLNLIKFIISNLLKLRDVPAINISVLFGGDYSNYRSKDDGKKLIDFLKENARIAFWFGKDIFTKESDHIYYTPNRPENDCWLGHSYGRWLSTFGQWHNVRYISVNKNIKMRPTLKRTFDHADIAVTVADDCQSNTIESDEDDSNATSIVLKITLANKTIILTGDKTKNEIRNILTTFKAHKRELKADILLATHHGSSEDFSLEWLAATQPHFAVFSAGRKYGHPARSTVSQYYQLMTKPISSLEKWHFIKFSGRPFPAEPSTPFIVLPITNDFMSDGIECPNVNIVYEEHPDSSLKTQGYCNAIMKKNIVMTCTQGNIIFLIHSDDSQPIQYLDETSFGDIELYAVFEKIIMASARTFPIRGIFLNNKTSAVYQLLKHRDPELANVIAKTLQDGKLEELSMINCDLYDAIDSVLSLIGYFAHLKKLNLNHNRFSENQIKLIKKEWGYRGLSLSS